MVSKSCKVRYEINTVIENTSYIDGLWFGFFLIDLLPISALVDWHSSYGNGDPDGIVIIT
jgi:hypothetical protein